MKKQPLITLNLSCHFEDSLKKFHSLIFWTWILWKVPNFLFHIPGEQQHSWQNVTDLRILPGVCQLLPQQEIIYFFKEKFFVPVTTCKSSQFLQTYFHPQLFSVLKKSVIVAGGSPDPRENWDCFFHTSPQFRSPFLFFSDFHCFSRRFLLQQWISETIHIYIHKNILRTRNAFKCLKQA